MQTVNVTSRKGKLTPAGEDIELESDTFIFMLANALHASVVDANGIARQKFSRLPCSKSV
jgi:hypothetical protein